MIVEIGKSLNISTLTIHISVFYLDYCLSKIDLDTKLHKIVALTCLIIAAKYDELDRNIPINEDFIKASGLDVQKQTIIDCEMHLLEVLNWNLRVVTPIIFAQLLLTQGIFFTSDTPSKSPFTDSLPKKLSRQIFVYLDSALECNEMLEFSQSVIAASCIALCRQTFGIEPVWPIQLATITGYEYDSIKDCVKILSEYYYSGGVISTKSNHSEASRNEYSEKTVLEPQNSFLNLPTSQMTVNHTPTIAIPSIKIIPTTTNNTNNNAITHQLTAKTPLVEDDSLMNGTLSKIQIPKPQFRPRSRVILRLGEDGHYIKNNVTTSSVSVNKSISALKENPTPQNAYQISKPNAAPSVQIKKMGRHLMVRDSIGGFKGQALLMNTKKFTNPGSKENYAVMAKQASGMPPRKLLPPAGLPKNKQVAQKKRTNMKNDVLPQIQPKNLRAY